MCVMNLSSFFPKLAPRCDDGSLADAGSVYGSSLFQCHDDKDHHRDPHHGSAPSRITPTDVTGADGYLWLLWDVPCAAGTCRVLMRSADGGSTWSRFGAPPADMHASSSVIARTATDSYSTTPSGGPSLYQTTDGASSGDLCLRSGLLPHPSSPRTDERSSLFTGVVPRAGASHSTWPRPWLRAIAGPLSRSLTNPVSNKLPRG